MAFLAIVGVVLFGLGIGVCIGVPALLLRSWAFVTLWSWFAVPVFGLPAIGYAAAMGIMTLVGVVQHEPSYKNHELNWNVHLTQALVGPFVSVGIGWLIKHFGGL